MWPLDNLGTPPISHHKLIPLSWRPASGGGGTINSYVGSIPGFLNFGTPANGNANFSLEVWVNGGFGQNTDAGIITLGYGNGGEQFNLDCGGSDPAHRFRFFVRDAAGGVHAA